MQLKVAKVPHDNTVVPVPLGTVIPARTPKNRSTKFRQLQRSDLDGRSPTARLFCKLARGVQDDIAPNGELSTVQQALIESFAGATVIIDHLNAKLLCGESVDLNKFAMITSVLVRLSSRLGIARVSRDEPPDPMASARGADLLANLNQYIEQAADAIVAKESK